MEEAQIILERHEQRLNTLDRDISDLKANIDQKILFNVAI